jgi:hypothetical protein
MKLSFGWKKLFCAANALAILAALTGCSGSSATQLEKSSSSIAWPDAGTQIDAGQATVGAPSGEDYCRTLWGPGRLACENPRAGRPNQVPYLCPDPTTDHDHCGACGAACALAEACVEGTCALTVCLAGQTSCDGKCLDLGTDRFNCGACANACANYSDCSAGVCATPSCAAGKTNCGGLCADLQTDNFNCGACGEYCTNGQSCRSGACASVACGNAVCEAGETDTTCPQDCCGANTACDQILAGTSGSTARYCRAMSSDGSEGAYRWITEDDALAYCSLPQHRCHSTYACGHTTGICKSIPNGWWQEPTTCP